ncbi:hypothetical protein NPIL_40391 [Nephila pilipes]|uniref:Uncharacterized protein n=1 Tax=Nephila pilipes TaxID=299642 RepID=A0A8X6Q5C1_NEPPI|nr:hypothetical protein NPIL_40391 [Nephila pilipes]
MAKVLQKDKKKNVGIFLMVKKGYFGKGMFVSHVAHGVKQSRARHTMTRLVAELAFIRRDEASRQHSCILLLLLIKLQRTGASAKRAGIANAHVSHQTLEMEHVSTYGFLALV